MMLIYLLIILLIFASFFNPIILFAFTLSYVWIIILCWFFFHFIPLGIYRYLLGGMILAVVIDGIFKHRSIMPKIEPGLLLSIMLAFIMLASSILSCESHQLGRALHKISLFAFGNIGLYYCASIIFRRSDAVPFFSKIYFCLSFLFAMFYIFLFLSGNGLITDRFLISNEISNPIGIGRYFGSALIVTLYIFFETKSKVSSMANLFIFFAIILFLIATALTGSKGPLFTAILLSFFYLYIYKIKTARGFSNISKSIIGIYTIIGFILLIGLICVSFVPPMILERFYGNSYKTRLEIWPIALDLIRHHPWGIGSDMFNIVALHKYKLLANYPHNIFLELFVENGLLAGIIFILFSIYFLGKIIKIFLSKKYNNEMILVSFLFLFAFLSAQVSSSICGNRNLWAFGGMLVGSYEWLMWRSKVNNEGKK